VAQSGGRAGAAPHRLCRLAVCMSVISASLLSAAGVAVSQNAPPSLQAPDTTRMQAPIGQLDPPSIQTQPQKQTPNRRAQAGSVPIIDARKGLLGESRSCGLYLWPKQRLRR
jgi:hypothetical protein